MYLILINKLEELVERVQMATVDIVDIAGLVKEQVKEGLGNQFWKY
jgi:ribosome-binding ATPase YchF (GTP1/OBG family)